MKVERLWELADLIENSPEGAPQFNMMEWGRNTGCRTVACIAGLAVWRWDPSSFHDGDRIPTRAAEILDIDPSTAESLFVPFRHLNASRKHAAAVLRHFAATGIVDWED